MKTIRWFLSHFFLVLLVVAVIYGYMYWGNLAGKDTPAGKAVAYLSGEFVEVKEFVDAVKAKQAQLSTEHATTETKQTSDVVAEAKTENVQSDVADKQPAEIIEERVEEKAEEKPPVINATIEPEEKAVPARNIEQQPVSISYSHNQMRVMQNSVGQISSQPDDSAQTEVAAASIEPETQAEPASAPVADAEPEAATMTASREQAVKNATLLQTASRVETATLDRADNFVSPKIEQQLNNVDKNGKVINQAIKTYAIRDSWITARKSFYQRKYELSEQSYRDVINNTTDNFDAYGELGNVYFNQGKNTEAAAAYFEAASILVRKGKVSRARSLMGLLKHLDDSKAADLQKLIDSAAS